VNFNRLQSFIPLLSRLLLAAIFLKSGIEKLLDPTATQTYMQGNGVPGILLWPTIAVLLAGGLSVLCGYRAKWGALLLVGFLIPTTVIFHTNFSDSSQQIQFFKNLGLMGGLLMVWSYGSGPFSVDDRL
jgi:putative oxidoreductase